MSKKDAKHASATLAAAIALSLAGSNVALAAPQPQSAADTAGARKQSMARSVVTSADRASNPDVAKQASTRSDERRTTKASRTGATVQESMTRLAATSADRASKPDLGKQAATRSTEEAKARAAGRNAATQDMTRSAKPSLRAPKPAAEPRKVLAMRTAPQEQSVRSGPASAGRKAIRTNRANWLDWLFGR